MILGFWGKYLLIVGFRYVIRNFIIVKYHKAIDVLCLLEYSASGSWRREKAWKPLRLEVSKLLSFGIKVSNTAIFCGFQNIFHLAGSNNLVVRTESKGIIPRLFIV